MFGIMLVVMGIFPILTLLRHHIGPWASFIQAPLWLLGPLIAAIQRRPNIERIAIDASPEGVRMGDKLVPRAKLRSALLRREGSKTFVLLRGKTALLGGMDVEVESDEEADRLCSALALDAKTTTAEFMLYRKGAALGPLLINVAAITVGVSMLAIAAHQPLVPLVILALFGVGALVGLPFLVRARQMKLLVGADGLVVKRGLKRSVFYAHDEILRVDAKGSLVIITLARGETITLSVGSQDVRKKEQSAELETRAKSIVWRIEKAREAYRSLAGAAPQAAQVLGRGDRTTREWIDQLRRVGEGATATFRSMLLTREQLMSIVESTSVAAKERLAAAVALRFGLTDEEKPRIRIAAERCVLPALRERMVRVVDAESDAAVMRALEEAEASDVSDADDARRAMS